MTQDILINTDDGMQQVWDAFSELEPTDMIAVDTETNGLREEDFVVGMSIYFPKRDTAYYISVRHGVGDLHRDEITPLDLEGAVTMQVKLAYLTEYYKDVTDYNNISQTVWEQLISTLNECLDSGVRLIFHNALFDIGMLHKEGMQIPANVYDSIMLAYLFVQDMGKLDPQWTGIDENGDEFTTDLNYKLKTLTDNLYLLAGYKRKSDMPVDEYPYPMRHIINVHDSENEMDTAITNWFDAHSASYRRFVAKRRNDALYSEYLEYPDKFIALLKLDAPKFDESLGEYATEQFTVAMENWVNSHEHVSRRSFDKKIKPKGYAIPSPTNVAKAVNTATGNRKAEPNKVLMWMLDASHVAQYACNDVRLTYSLYLWFAPILKTYVNPSTAVPRHESQYPITERGKHDYSLLETWHWYSEIISVYAHMNRNGFGINRSEIFSMYEDLNETLQDLQRQADDIIGYHIPLGTSNDMRNWVKDNVKGYKGSLDKNFKEKYKDANPVISLLDRYSKAEKLLNTFVEAWMRLSSDDGEISVIHPNLIPNGAATGRISAYSPNLQQVPRSGKPDVKKLLRSPVNNEYVVELDYAQLELRVASYIFERMIADVLLGRKATIDDTRLYNLVVSGGDMHSYTAKQVRMMELYLGDNYTLQDMLDYAHQYDLMGKLEDVDKTSFDDVYKVIFKNVARQNSKVVNFASLYGGGGGAIQKVLPVSYEEAKAVAQLWREAYPLQALAMNKTQNWSMMKRRLVENMHSYIMYPTEAIGIPLFWRNYNYLPLNKRLADGRVLPIRKMVTRKSGNSIVQGTASLIMSESIRRVQQLNKELGGNAVRFLCTVHDSMIFALPDTKDIPALLDKIIWRAMDYPTSPVMTVDIEMCPKDKGWGYKMDYNHWVEHEGKDFDPLSVSKSISSYESMIYEQQGVNVQEYVDYVAKYQ